jgi:hypothetical protein
MVCGVLPAIDFAHSGIHYSDCSPGRGASLALPTSTGGSRRCERALVHGITGKRGNSFRSSHCRRNSYRADHDGRRIGSSSCRGTPCHASNNKFAISGDDDECAADQGPHCSRRAGCSYRHACCGRRLRLTVLKRFYATHRGVKSLFAEVLRIAPKLSPHSASEWIRGIGPYTWQMSLSGIRRKKSAALAPSSTAANLRR